MQMRAKHIGSLMLWGILLSGILLMAGTTLGQEAGTIPREVGEIAPDFKLPGTTGGQISLSQFRGKKLVLIEFYGVDFAPT